jgi:hypothetical protein
LIDEKPMVQLRCASLPHGLGLLADHCWFVVFEPDGACHRWEVWQTANAGGRSIGHLHCDLKAPDAGVGGGPTRVLAQWTGEPARRLRAALAGAADYPHCGRYFVWPGPNSNTFVAWVLKRAGVDHRLSWRAFGKGYPAG